MDRERRAKIGIFFAALVVALGGIIYELLLGTVSSYLLSDSVLQFSLTIGFMLFGMGIGSWMVSRYTPQAEASFIINECLIALIGANAPAFFFWVFNHGLPLYPIFFGTVLLIGILIGLEIPLLFHLVNQKQDDGTRVLSRILSLDYLGSLIASLAFPLLFLPKLGLIRTAYVVGLFNACAALLMYVFFYDRIRWPKAIGVGVLVVVLGLSGGTIYANTLATRLEQGMYKDQIIFSEQSPYQKIVLTRFREDVRLFLNANLQFSSVDEYRYHEPLVHVPLAAAPIKKRVLFLGGGDGLALREAQKHQDIEHMTLVDLDSRVTKLAMTHPLLRELNKEAMMDDRLTIRNEDAFAFLRETTSTYDVIIADLPDPNDEGLAKLYSREMYELVRRRLSRGGVFMTQATSPFYSNDTFWLIERTVRAAGFKTYPMHVQVPSFGEWGMVLASVEEIDTTALDVSVPTRYLSRDSFTSLFSFEKDLLPRTQEQTISTLTHPRILEIYLREARAWRE